MGMRDGQAARTKSSSAPQDDIEVQNSGAPAPAATAAELALHHLEARQHLGRLANAFDKRDGIGEVPAGPSMGGIEDDRRGIEEAEFLIEASDRCFDDAGGSAVPAMWPVRPDRDRVEI